MHIVVGQPGSAQAAAFLTLAEGVTERLGALSALKLPPALVGRYEELTRDAIFYLDPHVCLRCRYRSTELLWQCPHCHEWNTFVEERIAPAKEAAEA